MSAKETLIKVENLQKYYKGGAIKALDGINTEIKRARLLLSSGPPAPANPPSCAV